MFSVQCYGGHGVKSAQRLEKSGGHAYQTAHSTVTYDVLECAFLHITYIFFFSSPVLIVPKRMHIIKSDDRRQSGKYGNISGTDEEKVQYCGDFGLPINRIT